MKTIVSLLGLCAAAGAAQGVVIYDVSNTTIRYQPIDSYYGSRDTGTIYDSSTTASAGGTTVTSPNNIVEDYTSIAVDPVNILMQHIFVGGVATANHVLFFNFYDAGGNYTGGYGVRLPQAGNFVWTVTLNPYAGGAVPITPAGYDQMVPDSGTNNPGGVPSVVTFRYTSSAPTVGSTNGTVYRQAFIVPAPASVALLGLGALVAGRRRR